VGSSLIGYDGGQNVGNEERLVEQQQKLREQKTMPELVPDWRQFTRELVPDWRPNREQVLWAVRIAVVVAITLLGILVLLWVISILFGVKLMDLLKILTVPITVGAAVPLLNWLQKKRELDIEHERAQDDALQAYFDQVGELLLQRDTCGQLLIDKRGENPFEGDFVSSLIRARTLTILALLDSNRPISRRKGSVLQFLYESGLIKKSPEGVVKLRGDAKTNHPLPTTPGQSAADLSRVDLRRATLSEADLSGTRLSYASLSDAKLDYADLQDINLFHTDLSRTNLGYSDLSKADLRGANLSHANMDGAILSKADLSKADLSGALEVIAEQLDQAESLEGAIMPNGQKYEDWLKVKTVITCKPLKGSAFPLEVKNLKDKEGSGEDEENSGPS
jgi:Pentapeptide repeats (8 copies)